MNTEQHYITGFNTGYLLAEHEPKLLNNIVPSIHPTNNYLEGLLDGKEQLELNMVKSRLTELDHLRKKSLDKTKDLDRE